MRFLPLIFILFSLQALADNIFSEVNYDESENLYQGYRAGFEYQKTLEEGFVKQLRAGASGLSGKFVSGETMENKTVNLGLTAKFDNSYSEFEGEASENDNRKPFSKLRLQHYIPWRSNEIGVGYQHAAFSGVSSKVAILNFAHFLNDYDFIGATIYADMEKTELTSYRAYLRNFFNNKWDTRISLAAGKGQQDIGVIQDFTALALSLSYQTETKSKIGIVGAKSWGKLVTDSSIGISYLCQF